MVIECVGDEVKVWVNGDLVNHGTKCTATKGQIALQAEGSEVEFRKARADADREAERERLQPTPGQLSTFSAAFRSSTPFRSPCRRAAARWR